jgi:fluoroquinolone resistance protein
MDFQNENHDAAYTRLQGREAQIQRKEFHHCTFTDCHFPQAQVVECQFYECTFKNCDLSNLMLNASAFVSTVFEGCKLIGVNWTDADWTGFAPRKVDFYDCNLSYSTFMHLKLPKVHLKGCTAHDVDFAEADLSGADCRKTDFAEARFMRTNLSKADFTGAINYTIDPAVNTIKKAKFALPEAVSFLRLMDIVLVDD